jgi:hypothetical protein
MQPIGQQGEASRATGAIRRVTLALCAWAVFAIAAGAFYVADGSKAAWVGIGVGVLSLALAFWGRRRRLWLQPLFAAMYLLALAMVLAGLLTDLDVYAVGGIVSLIVLSVGACLLVRLGEVRDAIASARRRDAS